MGKIEGLQHLNSRQTVRSLQIDQKIDEVYLVSSTQLGVGKNGKQWMSVTLSDATGDIDGRVWDGVERVSKSASEGSYVRVKGSVTSYLDRPQIRVESLSTVEKSSVDVADFLRNSGFSSVSLVNRLDVVMGTWSVAKWEELYRSYREDTRFFDAFIVSPAAKSVHHGYVRGLLEHTVSMVELAQTIGKHYQNLGLPVDLDILRLGIFLHDSGKIWELSAEPGFAYTDSGRLLGHIYMGAREAEERMRKLNFSENDRVALIHVILSHHGELEYGSPRRPKTLEAFLVHLIDSMDSKVQTWHETVSKGTDSAGWTGFVPSLSRFLKATP